MRAAEALDLLDDDLGARSVSSWAERFLAEACGHLRARTVGEYEGLLHRYVLPRWGTVPVNHLDLFTIEAWLADLSASGLSAVTVKNTKVVFGHVANVAVRAGAIARNPVWAQAPGPAHPATLELRHRANGGNAELARLALRYSAEKHKLGDWNQRSASLCRNRLLDFASQTGVPPERLTRRQVVRWLAREDLAPWYRRNRLSTLRGFCQWLVVNGHLRSDPTVGIKSPKLPPLIYRALSKDECSRLLAACAGDLRLQVIVLLMLHEGLRRAEVAAIDLGDLDLRKNTLAVRGKGGAGGLTAVLPITDECRAAIVAYIEAEQITHGPLIRSKVGRTSRNLTPKTIGHLILGVMREAGVKSHNLDGKSAHALRHTCAQDLVDSGIEVRVVQKVLRHASIRNTELYLRGEVSGLREAMEGRSYRPGMDR